MPRIHAKKLEVDLTIIGVDEENPRLSKQISQPTAIMAMVENQKTKIVNLAEDINENGLSDAERFMVMETVNQPFSYITLDGNRRLVALKLLDNPSLAEGILTGKTMDRLKAASINFKANPITRAEVVVFANRQDAAIWMERRHSIDMKGIGQERWNPIEIRRFVSRLDAEGKTNKTSPELQILDFVFAHGNLTKEELDQIRKRRFPITNLRRIIIDTKVRENIGYVIESNTVITDLADSEIVKPFKRMVLDLTIADKKDRIDVTDLESSDNRLTYISGFGEEDIPSSIVPLVMLHSLGEANQSVPKSEEADDKEKSDKKGTDGKNKEKAEKPTRKRAPSTRKKTTNQRVGIIPDDCHLAIGPQRIHDIYHELQVDLDSNLCSNASAVLLRVFIELSLDNYLKQNSIVANTSKSSPSMSDKLHAVGRHVVAQGLMTKSDAEPIYAAAKTDSLLAPTVLQMHTYVHKEISTPIGSDLRKQWNNLQPLMEIIWPA
jgi:hypothetical protein